MLLDEIVASKKLELFKVNISAKISSSELAQLPKTRPFLSKKRFNLIAEIKRASPSAGTINENLNIPSLAKAYEEGGAAAISVLTDEKYFHGRLDDLAAAKQATTIPILRKDFIIDESQLYQSRLAGADAVLLIVRILTEDKLKALFALAGELGLAVLVETHNAVEVGRALKLGAPIIGINNRDLDTLAIDLKTTLDLLNSYPELKQRLVISESGIKTKADVEKLKAAGAGGILVGEALLKSDNIPAKIEALIN